MGKSKQRLLMATIIAKQSMVGPMWSTVPSQRHGDGAQLPKTVEILVTSGTQVPVEGV